MARSNSMPCTFAKTITRSPGMRRFLGLALSSGALLAPATAWADCTASGAAVTCSGTSAAYTFTGSTAATVTVNSDATVTAPIIVSTSGSTLTNAGTISNTATQYGLQFGDNATITNNGTLTSTGSSTGAGTISVGANSTVVNNGTLTAYSGTPVINFGTNGTFTNNTASAAAVTGTIVYGTNTGANRGTFNNYNTTYGVTGTVTATGNITFNNDGIFTGTFIQTAKALANAVTINNTTNGTFTGILITGDQTTMTNTGTMYLYSGSAIGTLGSYNSTVTNSGTLWVGLKSAPTQVTIGGNFIQTAAGNLNIAIAPAGSATTTAGTTYSQLYTSGTAQLGGTLTLQVYSGFYPTGTIYKVIDAAGGITGDFTTIAGNNQLFVQFNKLGVVTISGTEQAYEFVAQHLSYKDVMTANGANANQIAISGGLDKVLNYVTTTSGGTGTDAATLLGEVDLLDAPGAKVFLDSVSPEGYLAYAQALRDQANLFERAIDLRLNDQNSNHPEDGWWLKFQGQGSFSSTASTAGGYRTRDHLIGFSGGYDLSGPRHVIGAALNLSWDSLHYAPNSLTGTNRDLAVALYGKQKLGAFYVSGQVAYHMGHISSTKTVTIGDYVLTATGKAEESLFKVKGEAGVDLKVGNYTLTPFGGISLAKGKISSFSETGAGAANLTVSSINADRTDLIAGVSLQRSKGVFRPYVRALYRQALGSAGVNTVTAYMNAESDSTFTVTGLAPAKSEANANVGVNWVFDDAGSVFVGYQGTYRSNYVAHGVNVGLRLEF